MTCRYMKIAGCWFGCVILIISLSLTAYGTIESEAYDTLKPAVDSIAKTDIIEIQKVDSIGLHEEERYIRLTEEDFILVADELGIEVAAIKAVVEVEAGPSMKGFWAPGIPVINFDATMFSRYKGRVRDKVDVSQETIPIGLKGYALKEWTELINARKKNAIGALLGTFWGMFQIGGFNYKLCGCEDVNEFVRRISCSELEQLQLFAAFISNTGMVEFLKKKDWSGFARRYNGPSYAKRGYHTKIANAYNKYNNSK